MKLDEEVSAAVRDSFQAKKVESFTPLSGGHAHQTLLVRLGGKEVVLKIFDLEDFDDRFRKGFTVAPRLLEKIKEETEVPAPEPLGSGDIRGRPYYFLEKLEGKTPYFNSTGPYFDRISRENKKSILRQLGHHIASIHREIEFDRTGQLVLESGGICVEARDSWKDFLEEIFDNWLGDMNEKFSHMEPEIRSFLDDKLHLVEGISDYSLLHRELDKKNILVEGENLAGIVDWDDCISGHAEFDLFYAEAQLIMSLRTERLWKSCREHLYDGYRETRELDDGWRQRRNLYLLFPMVINMNFWNQEWKNNAEFYEKRCREILRDSSPG
ncbi:MAG: phosphotransferase family protein [Candidatus Nanohaloarchaea archaeon]